MVLSQLPYILEYLRTHHKARREPERSRVECYCFGDDRFYSCQFIGLSMVMGARVDSFYSAFYFNSGNIYGITFLKHLENILYALVMLHFISGGLVGVVISAGC